MAENEEGVAQTIPHPDTGEMSEDEIDRNLAETFPASDPPSWTLGTDHREESLSEPKDAAEGSEAKSGDQS